MRVDKRPIIKLVKNAIKNSTPMTLTDLARQTGRSRDCVSNVLKKAELFDAFTSIPVPHAELLKKQDEKIKLRRQTALVREGMKRIHELQVELALRDQLDRVSRDAIIHDIKIKKDVKKEATAFALAGDWHFDEKIDPAAIGGVNEFNLSIARRRSTQFFERTLKLLNMCRHESRIDRLVFIALGDFITGWIHEDLISETTPPEALLHVYEELVSGIQFLLDKGGLKEILFVGVCGNHGRITKRIHHKKSPEKNYEWLIYQFLAQKFGGEKNSRIKFLLPRGYTNWINVYDREIRIHHGNGIRYMGGIGGVHIPLRKAIAQWNKARHADLDILGHWHTREVSKDYAMNGSLIGYGEFSQAIKADFEKPSQSFFILHPKYGKTAEFGIVLD